MTEHRRRASQDQDLRRALLDAAADLVASSGPGQVSLREIARRCGVSHAAPAHHFADRATLLSALAAEGFRGLTSALAAVPPSAGRPHLAEMGVAYVTYAAGAPGHFPVMFRPELLAEGDPELVDARQAAFDALGDAVVAAQADGWAVGADHDAAVMTAWSTAHGLATLWLDGAVPPHIATVDLAVLALAMTDLVIGQVGARHSYPAGTRRSTSPAMEIT